MEKSSRDEEKETHNVLFNEGHSRHLMNTRERASSSPPSQGSYSVLKASLITTHTFTRSSSSFVTPLLFFSTVFFLHEIHNSSWPQAAVDTASQNGGTASQNGAALQPHRMEAQPHYSLTASLQPHYSLTTASTA